MTPPRVLLAVVIFCACVDVTDAQQNKSRLSATFTPLASRARVAAPIPGQWELSYLGSDILEGRLEATLELPGQKQSLVIPNLVVTGGVNPPFRGMLPALGAPTTGYDELFQATLSMRFVTADGQELELDSQPLMIPQSLRRSFVIGLCVPETSSRSDALRSLAEGLRFERLNPNSKDKSLNTLTAHETPEDMPADPLGYCAFDLLLLVDEAFAGLNQKSLDAISQWVRAGGSLCVLPGAALASRHLSFLNDATNIAGAEEVYVLDDEGRVTGGDENGFTLLRTGLGRMAIGPTNGAVARDVAAADWLRMALFLWKIKEQHREGIAATGAWRSDQMISRSGLYLGEYAQIDQENSESAFAAGQILSPTPPTVWSNEMVGQLMPKEFRFVPLWLMGLLLIAFVAAVGPVDYLLLGALKMRRMTWVLFPLTAFAFAYLTVWLANAYMGVTNETRAYEFLDVGSDGTLLRANRFELQFNGVAMETQTDVSHGLFTAFDTSMSPYSRGDITDNSPPLYQGRFPQGYGVSQNIAQWSPQLNHTFWIAPVEEIESPVKFPWNSLRTTDFETAAGRTTVLDRLLSPTAFGPHASVYLFHKNECDRLSVNRALMNNPHETSDAMTARRSFAAGNNFQIRSMPDGRRLLVYPNGAQVELQADQVVNLVGSLPDTWNGEHLLINACVQQSVGMFALVSQVAPTGGWNIDDLAILDPTDPAQWLLVVAQPRGNDVVIYRKLYRKR